MHLRRSTLVRLNIGKKWFSRVEQMYFKSVAFHVWLNNEGERWKCFTTLERQSSVKINEREISFQIQWNSFVPLLFPAFSLSFSFLFSFVHEFRWFANEHRFSEITCCNVDVITSCWRFIRTPRAQFCVVAPHRAIPPRSLTVGFLSANQKTSSRCHAYNCYLIELVRPFPRYV